jgi:ribosomal protein S18 acetylase RimI-like enzyme
VRLGSIPRDVARWITRWIWEDSPEKRQARQKTLIFTDEDRDGVLVGYGTWGHVEAFGVAVQPRHIEIAWFGVHTDYQGVRDEHHPTVAGLLYSTVEAAAKADPGSSDDMPLTLVCHVENERGLRFWRRRGYEVIPDPKLAIEDDVYFRMVRNGGSLRPGDS